MSGTIWKSLLLVSFLIPLSSCGSGGKTDAWEQATRARFDLLQDAKSLDGVTIPILKSEGLEQVWGAPEIKLDGQGGYLLNYRDPRRPFTRMMVHGMTKPLPKLSTPPLLSGEEMVNDQLTGFQRPQTWKTATIAGQEVRWFQETTAGGADGAYYSTEGFKLKSADGKVGYFRLGAEAGEDTAQVLRWFGSVSY